MKARKLMTPKMFIREWVDVIPLSMLDPATAAMVRELLEKQEGDAK